MKKSLLMAVALLSSAILSAHDFSVRLADGQQLYFNVTDAQKSLVELTYPVNITSTRPIFRGKLVVPATVKYNDKVYKVVSVGKKAFINDRDLTEVVLPSGLTLIDDFAFEGCTSLRNVVFPGNKIKFGSGTFFRCTAITNVTLGSDWTVADMKTFRWSLNLREINIPAKLEKINNLKSLKYLEKISVDANNKNFTAIDGVLYTKNGSALLCCPRKYSGILAVPEGTKEVRWGAIVDCTRLRTVILPSTLTSLSYREFAKLSGLENVVMKNVAPIATAQSGEQKFFLLTTSNPGLKLYVPKKAKKAYQKQLVTVGGNYSEVKSSLPDGMDAKRSIVPFEVKSNEIINVKNILPYSDISKLKL